MHSFAAYIRNVPDFPKEGIQFKDITTLIKDGELFAEVIDQLYLPFKDHEIQKVVGIESRGFIFGAALSYKLNAGFVPIRKPGKLPAEKLSASYELEYGTDSIEIHKDAILPGENVILVDDLLATGGTARAACELIEKLNGNIIGLSFLIELTELKGREKLKDFLIHSLLTFPY
ncbi:MAG: adenine phosphoribosyltransferase [Calditrichia bacterium]